MQVIIGLLGSLLTIFYLLDRLGIDLGGLNPFYWRRRRAWARKYQGDPIYSVEDPMDVAAILVVGIGKLDGELSAEQKQVSLQQFETRFSLASNKAAELFGSAAHLLGSPQVIDAQLNGVAEKNKGRFSREQSESMIAMMVEVASAGGDLSPKQVEYIESMRTQFASDEEPSRTWS